MKKSEEKTEIGRIYTTGFTPLWNMTIWHFRLKISSLRLKVSLEKIHPGQYFEARVDFVLFILSTNNENIFYPILIFRYYFIMQTEYQQFFLHKVHSSQHMKIVNNTNLINIFRHCTSFNTCLKTLPIFY